MNEEHSDKSFAIRAKGKRFRYDQPGIWYDACCEGILENVDMDATERLLYDFRASVDGYLPTVEIRRIRKKLGLTQKRASGLFGGGHNAFSRYEVGSARPPKSTDTLLRNKVMTYSLRAKSEKKSCPSLLRQLDGRLFASLAGLCYS